MRRTVTLLILLLTAAGPASAQIRQAFLREAALLARQPTVAGPQDTDSAWDRVRGLKGGKAIMLAEGVADPEPVRFLAADETTLTVKSPTARAGQSSRRMFARFATLDHHAREGMLWGLLAGAVAGFAKWTVEQLVGFCGMLGGGIGMGLGAAAGGAANVDARENALLYRRAY